MSLRRALPVGEGVPLTPSQKRLLLLATSLGMFAGILPSFPLTITLPTIARAFAVEMPTAQWVMTALFVAQAATMLPIGSASDIFGRVRVFILGYAVLILGLALTPFASTMGLLMAVRGVQGVGSGVLIVVAPAIVSAALPPSQRGRGVALVFLGGWLASLIGQPLFGALAQYSVWYSPFLLVLLPSVLGLTFALKLRKLLPQQTRERSFDPLGACLLVVAFGALVVGTGHGQEEHWEVGHTVRHVGPLFVASVVAIIFYLFHARRVRSPVLPLYLFRSLTLRTASITNVLLHMTMMMISFLMPFYLQNVLGYAPLGTAIFMIPMSITLNVMGYPSGWLHDKIGSRLPCTVAMLLGAVLLLSYRQLTETSSFLDVLPRLVLAGIVMGLFITPNISAMIGAVPEEHYSLISGFEKATQNVGHALGIVLTSAVATFYLGPAGSGADAATYVSIVHGAGLLAGLMLGAGAFLAWLRRESGERAERLVQPTETASIA